VLGLEDLTATDKRLQAAARYCEDKLSEAKKSLEQLRGRLIALAGQDERAAACAKALTGTKPERWDIDAALAIVTGSHHPTSDAGQIARLRSFANLTVASAAEVAGAAEALRKAAARLADLTGTAAEQAHDLAALLDAALTHHHRRGDGRCPVCGNPGSLTPAWRAATEQHRDRLRHEARAADEATASAKAAMARARPLIQALPSPLSSANPDDPAAAALAAEAWRRWAALPETGDTAPTATSLIAFADHVEATLAPLTAAVTTLVEQSALEDAVNVHWTAEAITEPMRQASMRSRLICLPAYLNRDVAHQITFVYAALSSACHYHRYELAPGAAELTGWITDVETLVAELSSLSEARRRRDELTGPERTQATQGPATPGCFPAG
jgi:hypothetical protein